MNTKSENSRKAIGAAALAAVIFGAAVPMAGAQNSGQVVLNPGTVIPVKLNAELTSNQAQAGDTFTATVDDSKAAYNRIMQGATVDGVVREATPQEGSNPGLLKLGFTRLRLADGRAFSISGAPISLDTKSLSTRSDGVLVAKNTTKDNRGTYAGIGAGAGLLLDVLKGGKLRIEDVLIGGVLGYGAGSLLKGQAQVHDVDLKPGTEMGVLLDSRTRYYHKTPAVVTKRRHRTLTPHNIR